MTAPEVPWSSQERARVAAVEPALLVALAVAVAW
jgi:hypothetical protein